MKSQKPVVKSSKSETIEVREKRDIDLIIKENEELQKSIRENRLKFCKQYGC
ncbi:hypothetical protein [Sporocytophaga myxococcoides]|uniref:hypothetical protein n=1 Tax=Sporocytophaga myxococcoides TaxID=153721 RepID=UPI0003FB1AD5|nr:hypothetical protein [Sporocytophaga myxococcoides]